MKRKYLLPTLIIGYFIILFIVASLINDLFLFLFEDKANNLFFWIIKVLLLFIFIEIILKYSKSGRELNRTLEKIVKKIFEKKKMIKCL
jgi:SNF family Na+-dependent transporter